MKHSLFFVYQSIVVSTSKCVAKCPQFSIVDIRFAFNRTVKMNLKCRKPREKTKHTHTHTTLSSFVLALLRTGDLHVERRQRYRTNNQNSSSDTRLIYAGTRDRNLAIFLLDARTGTCISAVPPIYGKQIE